MPANARRAPRPPRRLRPPRRPPRRRRPERCHGRVRPDVLESSIAMHFSVGAPITLATVGLALFAGQDTSQPWSAESETLTAQTDPLSASPGHEVLDLRASEETVDL